jgi:hypothetical protein
LLEEELIGKPYPTEIRMVRLARIAKINGYYQQRNAAARVSHHKRRQRELIAARVNPDLSCIAPQGAL